MQTISTKYYGPGNVRGARIVAKTSGGLRFTFPYEHGAGVEGNHLAAADAVARGLGWHGEWHGGSLNTHGDMIWVLAARGDASAFTIAA